MAIEENKEAESTVFSHTLKLSLTISAHWLCFLGSLSQHFFFFKYSEKIQ